MITDARAADAPIIYVNPAFEKITGYTEQEAIGRNCRFLQGPLTDRATVELIRHALTRAEHVQETIINYRKDGSSFSNEITISPVFSKGGQLTHFVGTQSDISDRVRLEEQLRQSQKMEAIGQLTGGIAHDFNNLLTIIAGNAELISEDASDPLMSEQLARMILEASQRGAELTQQLLAFARRQPLEPVHLALAEVVREMMPLLRRTISHGIEIRMETAETRLLALTDRTSLESAILNLIVNAKDALGNTGVVTIRTGERQAGPGESQLSIGQDAVFVTVADSGSGMQPEVLAKAFEPFFSTKDARRGSGLGLSMVYGFAQQSGGHVEISSQPGVGTAVTITLPAVVASRTLPYGASVVEGGLKRGSERLLVVEDEPGVLQLISAQLISLGYEVVAVGNAEDAIRTLNSAKGFDLLITDIILPGGVSGVELSNVVRQQWPTLKIIYMSGYSGDYLTQQRVVNDIPLLPKPFNRKQLAELLRSLLNGRAQSWSP